MSAVRERARLPAASAAAALVRLSGARIGFAVNYHRVDERIDDPARHVDPALPLPLFEGQLRHLAASYRPVRASELAAAIGGRRRGEPIPVAVTFDDDLETHERVAAPALARNGIPATFFLSGAVDGQAVRWWDDLQIAVDRKLIAPDALGEATAPALREALEGRPWAINRVAREIAELSPSERLDIRSLLRAAVGPHQHQSSLTPGQVHSLTTEGHEIGFHTRHHHPLATLNDDDLHDALTEGRPELEQLSGRRAVTIAYPHGSADERVARAASQAGFETGFTTTADAIGSRSDRLRLGRMSPWLDSAGRFSVVIALELFKAARNGAPPDSQIELR